MQLADTVGLMCFLLFLGGCDRNRVWTVRLHSFLTILLLDAPAVCIHRKSSRTL